MNHLETMTYEVTGRIARITLNRPSRGNGITFEMPTELAACVERADLDPRVHLIILSGAGKGFCGGYDLIASAQESMAGVASGDDALKGSPVDPDVVADNHDPEQTWDPVMDYQMMSRNVRGFMSLFHADKPVLCKVHGFCVAGGTDMALCSDLLIIADDAKIGYPPARVFDDIERGMKHASKQVHDHVSVRSIKREDHEDRKVHAEQDERRGIVESQVRPHETLELQFDVRRFVYGRDHLDVSDIKEEVMRVPLPRV